MLKEFKIYKFYKQLSNEDIATITSKDVAVSTECNNLNLIQITIQDIPVFFQVGSNICVIFNIYREKIQKILAFFEDINLRVEEYNLTLKELGKLKNQNVVNKLFSATIQPENKFHSSVFDVKEDDDDLFETQIIQEYINQSINVDIKEATMYLKNCIPFYYESPNIFLFGRKVKEEDICNSTQTLISTLGEIK